MKTIKLIGSVAGMVFLLVGVLGIINRIFDTNIGIGGRTGAKVTAPTEPVLIIVLLILGAALLVIPKLLAARNNSQS